MTSLPRRRFLGGIGAAALAASVSALASPIDALIGQPRIAAPSGRLAFAHYMTAGLRSFDNALAPDYYDRGYLAPGGEGGIHATYGGWSRNRPLYRPPIKDPGLRYQIVDAMWEVATARQAGLDGFAMLMPNFQGVHVPRMDDMWTGAYLQDPTFLIRMMPDMGGSIGNATQAQFVECIKRYAALPNTMRLEDGRVVLSPYRPELKSVTWWDQVIALLNSHTTNANGTTADPVAIAFVPVMLQFTTKFHAMPWTYAVGSWGSRSPKSMNPATSEQLGFAAGARNAGKRWVQCVALQQAVPHTKLYDEALGSLTLANCAQIAVNTNADWVDLETWNDPAEGTVFYPSRNLGMVPLELWRRLGAPWRAGAAWTPDDSFFVLHRPHFFDDKPSWSGYPVVDGVVRNLMVLRASSSPPADIIEVSSWFKAPTAVSILANDIAIAAYTAPAGYCRYVAPLAEGVIRVRASREMDVRDIQAPTAVTHYPLVQDETYWGAMGILGGV